MTLPDIRNDGYDVTFPITSIVDDTHLTVVLSDIGTQSGNGWFAGWPTSGNYVINGCAFPSSVDQVAGNITTLDVGGLTVGHAVDQTLAYNQQFLGIQMLQARHIGQAQKGTGLNIANVGTATSPQMRSAIGISGNYLTAMELQYSNMASGVPSYLWQFTNGRPSQGVFHDILPASSTMVNYPLWDYRRNDSPTFTVVKPLLITSDPANASEGLSIYDPGVFRVSSVDGVTHAHLQDQVNAQGTISNTVGGFGLYSNLALDSEFQTVAGTTVYSQFFNSSCVGPNSLTLTANAATDPWGGSKAMSMVSPSSFGTSGCAYAGIKQTESMTNGKQYTLSVWAKGAVGGELFSLRIGDSLSPGGCDQNPFPLTTALTRYSLTCTWTSASANTIGLRTTTASATISAYGLSLTQTAAASIYATTTSSTVNGAGLVLQGAVQANTAGTAPLTSPVFTGNPTAPTPLAGDRSTSLATTAFVNITPIESASPNINNSSFLMSGNTETACASGTGSILGASNSRPVNLFFTSGATNGNCAGWTSGLAGYSVSRQPLQRFSWGYSATGDFASPASTVIWLGMFGTCTAATMEASATPAGCDIAAIRYAPGTDTAYQCVTSSAGSMTVTPIGTVAPGVAFTSGSISFNAALNQVTCTVGTTSVTNGANIPASSINMSDIFTNTVGNSAAVHIELNGVKTYDQNSNF
jgi:hypothetical protein